MNKIKFLSLSLVVLASSFFLSGCGKKNTEGNSPSTNTKSTQKELVLSDSEKPIISLIPRDDGHELKLTINNIPSVVTQMEYELIYSSSEDGLVMEKGVGDSVKVSSKTIEKDLLLGTSSCTNGCKYKYDEGVSSGTLSLILYTDDNQSATYETPFILKTSSEVNSQKGFSLDDNFSVTGSTTTKSDYFVAIKNYSDYYSVFSNGKGTGKITSIEPSTITKQDSTSLVGDYLIN